MAQPTPSTVHRPPSTVTFHARPQPSFNKNFNLLIRTLHELRTSGYEIYICSDNPKQLARLQAIFKELKADIEWFPVETALSNGFIDEELKIACLTDHQIFQRFHAFKLRTGFTKEQALNVRLIRELQPGDYVTHIDHGIGKYSGLQKIEIGGQMQEAVRLVYKNNDILYVSIHSLHKISKYVGKEGEAPNSPKSAPTPGNNSRPAPRKKSRTSRPN
jgi:transcription-repair coupling factor (superfamily II helicase)